MINKMRSFRSILQLAIILVLSIAAFPIYRGHAQPQISPAVTSSTICVTGANGCPANTEGVPGTSFSVKLVLTNELNFTGYKITLNWNKSIIVSTNVAQGNWTSGPCRDSSGAVVVCTPFTITNSTTNGSGTLTVSQALLGSATNITASSLIIATFGFVAFGSSPITISEILLSGVRGSSVVLLPTPAITNGNAFTPPAASAELIKSKISPAFHKLSISHNGDVQMLTALVANTGPGVAFVRVDFTIVSASGDVQFQRTGVLNMPVGTLGTLSVAYSVPFLPNKYFVIGNLEVSGDGVLFIFSGSSKSFSYSVSP